MKTYFTISELTHSDTANMFGINNTPNKEIADKLHILITECLDPIREKCGFPIAVTSGYRCESLNKKVGGKPTSQHCFDAETEILTNRGWLKYYEITNNDRAINYNISDGCIEEDSIQEVITNDFDGEMYGVKTKTIDILATDKHRMLVRYNNKKYIKKTKITHPYFDSLKTDNDKWHIENMEDVYSKRRQFLHSGYKHGEKNCDINILLLGMAFLCDGFYHKHTKNHSLSIGFHLKKERKIKRVRELFDNANFHYTEYIDKDGYTCICSGLKCASTMMDIFGWKKSIPFEFLKYDYTVIKQLLNELLAFDGYCDKRDNHTSVAISSINKNNIDVIQAMFTLTGYRTSVNVKEAGLYNIRGKCGIRNEYYSLSATPNIESRANENAYYKQYYKGVVWCISTNNGTVIIRRKGRVTIQGNCKGEAADLIGKNDEQTRKIFEVAKSLGNFDQLLFEKNASSGKKWVHISYKKSGNRKQCIDNYNV